jgi:hypothetical protein
MSAHRNMRSAIVALLLLADCVAPAQSQQSTGQPKASQAGSVVQQVADTKITIQYNRPVARGRELFGKLVPFDKAWNPGADAATSITTSTPIKVNGQALAAGSYTLWMIPGADRWTWIFSKAYPAFHLPYPGEGRDALRLTVKPRTGSHMETLAFYFPVVHGKKAELVLHWGTLAVPVEIVVP